MKRRTVGDDNPDNTYCELSCLSCLVHSHMLVPAVTFSPQAPHSADPSGTAEVSAPLGKVSEWIVLAFRCTVRFLPEAALLKLCSRVNLPDPAPSCCFETVTWVRPVSIHRLSAVASVLWLGLFLVACLLVPSLGCVAFVLSDSELSWRSLVPRTRA